MEEIVTCTLNYNLRKSSEYPYRDKDIQITMELINFHLRGVKW